LESEEENTGVCKKREKIPTRKYNSLEEYQMNIECSSDEQQGQQEKQLPRPPPIKQSNFNAYKQTETGIYLFYMYLNVCSIVIIMKNKYLMFT